MAGSHPYATWASPLQIEGPAAMLKTLPVSEATGRMVVKSGLTVAAASGWMLHTDVELQLETVSTSFQTRLQ